MFFPSLLSACEKLLLMRRMSRILFINNNFSQAESTDGKHSHEKKLTKIFLTFCFTNIELRRIFMLQRMLHFWQHCLA